MVCWVLVFAALTAAIIASTASKINSIATIFTLDLYARKFHPAPARRNWSA
jgi:SSS family solute:Na+ symporter